jgi:hypothetical protein
MGISTSRVLNATAAPKSDEDVLGFHNISKAISTHRMAPSAEITMDYKCIPADDFEAIMATIIRQIYERRIRAADLFIDFDKSKCGDIDRIQFIRGLFSAKLQSISPSALETVANAYAIPSDVTKSTIRWRDFAEDVEKAFSETRLEKDPTKRLDSFARTVVTSPHPRLVRPSLEPAATAALERALEEIKHHIKTWRTYNVKAFLGTYDRASEGMVTETQFLRVLASFNLVPAEVTGRSALLDYYRGTGHRSHMIDYRAFLREVYNDGIE